MKNSDKRLYALALVGGKGERLRPFTADIPKPMVSVNNAPFLIHHTRMLVQNGVTDIVFLCGYKGDKVRELFGDGAKYRFNAQYHLEKNPLGRGGAFKVGLNMLPRDCGTVVATNGDMFTDQPLQPMLKTHRNLGVKATALLVPYPNQYGVVQTDDKGLVTDFSEKQPLAAHVNAGLYLFEPDIRRLLPEVGDHEVSTFPTLVKQKQLAGFKSDRLWFSIETLKDLHSAEKLIKNYISPI